MTIIFYNCDGNVAFSHAFYNSHVFTGWNKLLLYTFNSTVIISILSLYIPFSRYSKINFLREYQKGLSRRYCLLDFNVKVRGVGYIGYTNDFTPQQSQAWGRSCWSLIKLLVIVTLNNLTSEVNDMHFINEMHLVLKIAICSRHTYSECFVNFFLRWNKAITYNL